MMPKYGFIQYFVSEGDELEIGSLVCEISKEKKATSDKKKNKPTKNIPNLAGKKMGRNEPCFCGSGKKYKYCCGAL